MSYEGFPNIETCLRAFAAFPSDRRMKTLMIDAALEIERLRGFIAKPPRHKFWGAGEPYCPRDIKAGNGELHTLRCKACGIDNPPDKWCRVPSAEVPQ